MKKEEKNTGVDIVYTEHSFFEIRAKIERNEFNACLSKYSKYTKDIVFELAKNNIPFHMISFGAGVYKMIKNGYVCDKCLGKGYIKSL